MLSSLAMLRARILPAALAEITKYDTRLGLLGDAIQAQLETYCGRQFAYLVDAEEEFPGHTLRLSPLRYPIKEVTSLTRTDRDGTESSDLDNIELTNKRAGIITLYAPGTEEDTLTLTYTGGFTIDTTDDLSYTPATGEIMLPADIREAWFLQVAQAHAAADSTGKPIPEGQPSTPSTALLSSVKELLQPYRRLA